MFALLDVGWLHVIFRLSNTMCWKMIELWRSVTSHPDLYEVSSFGRVKSLGRKIVYPGGWEKSFQPKILKPRVVGGYHHVTLTDLHRKKLQISVHVLVATYFIGPRPEGFHLDHLNAIKSDNRVENLEWVTRSENTKRAHGMGLMTGVRRGEDSNLSRIKEEAVLKIAELDDAGVKRYKIASQFGVTTSTVSSICNGQTWGWLTKRPLIPRKKRG